VRRPPGPARLARARSGRAPPDAHRLFSLRSTPFFNPYFSWWGGYGWWY